MEFILLALGITLLALIIEVFNLWEDNKELRLIIIDYQDAYTIAVEDIQYYRDIIPIEELVEYRNQVETLKEQSESLSS